MSQETKVEEKPIEVHVDLSKILERFDKLEAIIAELKKKPEAESEGGKGLVASAPAENRLAKILEAIRHNLKEQWEAPFMLPSPPTASVLSFVQQSDAIAGKLGDTVNIPYVKRFDADVLGSVGATLTPKSGLYDVAATTLKEAAFTTEIPYADVEKLSEKLLSQIEAQGQKAIIRAIDSHILSAVSSASGVKTLAKGSESVNFDADWIAEALTSIEGDVDPQEFMLVLTPNQYLALYKDIVSAQAITYARPDVVKTGLIQEFMGVTIKVMPKALLPNHTSNTKKSALMIHRDAVVFAPKREMLFETEKNTVARKVLLTGSYTFGVAVVDPACCVVIQTPEAAS
jgi:hypothetical protein